MRSKLSIAIPHSQASPDEDPSVPLTTGPLCSAMGVIYGLLFSGVLWVIGGVIALWFW
jgi:hypothetical protein